MSKKKTFKQLEKKTINTVKRLNDPEVFKKKMEELDPLLKDLKKTYEEDKKRTLKQLEKEANKAIASLNDPLDADVIANNTRTDLENLKQTWEEENMYAHEKKMLERDEMFYKHEHELKRCRKVRTLLDKWQECLDEFDATLDRYECNALLLWSCHANKLKDVIHERVKTIKGLKWYTKDQGANKKCRIKGPKYASFGEYVLVVEDGKELIYSQNIDTSG